MKVQICMITIIMSVRIQVSVENCKNVTVNVKFSPLTSYLEVVNCDYLNVKLDEGVTVSTVCFITSITKGGQNNISLLENNIETGGGANTKVPDMYGVGGCFRDPKHKSNMYTFVQQRGVSIFYPESQKYKWYFCTHIS